jgi:hypothetical protein
METVRSLQRFYRQCVFAQMETRSFLTRLLLLMLDGSILEISMVRLCALGITLYYLERLLTTSPNLWMKTNVVINGAMVNSAS